MAKEIPQLRRYAFVLTRDGHAADDLVQDCLERAIRKRHLWKRHGSIRSWLYRILYRVFINQGRHRERIRQHVDIDEVSTVPFVPPRQEQTIACAEIGDAIADLPPEQSAAIGLTAIEGFSYEEAAAIMGIPIGTLRSRLFRGRERLRELYDPEHRQFDRVPPVQLRRVK
jgi:RNA polymerase sigma-70 factor (ECF subfamily)